MHAKAQATGSEILAGILKAIIRTRQTKIGRNAKIGNRTVSIKYRYILTPSNRMCAYHLIIDKSLKVLNKIKIVVKI